MIKNPKELFVALLSDLRQREERTTDVLQELSDAAKNPDIKEALESRVFLKNQIMSSLDRCFKLIGEQPVKVNDRLHDIFVEDFRRELNEIQSPIAKSLYVMAKARQLMQARIGEYVALTAMADVTGHFGVGVLLESCLADKLAFIERTRRLVRNMVENEVAARLAA
jgi:ferritin-like metal-binding protein YciE